ncbi:hypothetical protein MMC25_003877 [Agyrium rufum]|nr:hypothetical protein [Agyrium rufum]
MINALAKLFVGFLFLATGSICGPTPDRRGFNLPPDVYRAVCQAPTENPLTGCPAGTLLVGPTAKYKTIQSAVASLPNNTHPAVILILPGNYTEQVNVTRSAPLYLLGQTSHIKSQARNTVNVVWRAVAGTGDNAYTATLTVAPNLNADLTGSGPTGFSVPPGTPFGNTDFRTYNLNFINDYAPYSVSPSLALSMGYANAGFYYSGFFSYQDTIYVGKIGSAYFYKSTIAGQTDFFYGFGTAWVQSSDIELRSCGGGITAWKGTNTTFENKYGIYVTESNVHAANTSLSIVGKCALGRPWNAQIRAIFSYNYLDSSILPAGYIQWSATDPRVNNYTFQAEYKDYGPGFNLSARDAAYPITKELTAAQFAPYSSPRKVFQFENGAFGNDAWIDYLA